MTTGEAGAPATKVAPKESPAALLAIVVYAWTQQKGSSGSYGTYSNVQKLFGRKP